MASGTFVAVQLRAAIGSATGGEPAMPPFWSAGLRLEPKKTFRGCSLGWHAVRSRRLVLVEQIGSLEYSPAQPALGRCASVALRTVGE